ncbi:MAG: hypothetical protein V4697_00380 [Patescibacteria group bacterium]
MEKESSTTNVILVILLVIIVGFVVWFVMDRKAPADTTQDTSGGSLEINVGGSAGNPEPTPAQ